MTAEAHRPILHGANISPYVRKVRVALAWKGIEYDNTQQNPWGAGPEYVAKHPLSKIPLWEEGEAATAGLLGNPRLPRSPLPGAGTAARGAGPAGTCALVRGVRRQHGHDDAGGCLLRARGETHGLQAGGQPAGHRTRHSTRPCRRYSTTSRNAWAKTSTWWVARSPSRDIALTSPFVNFAIAGETVDAERWPQIAAWVRRIHSLPCYAPIVAGDMPANE